MNSNPAMKSTHLFAICVALLILAAAVLIAASFMQPVISTQELNAAALRVQVTATTVPQDHSVIGSTDGIVVMGFLIVLIVMTPLVVRPRRK